MNRVLPHPLLSLALVLAWLLMTRFSIGQALIGTVLALVAGRALAALDPGQPRLRRIGPLLRLVPLVAADILRSNLMVARLILTGGRHGRRRSAFLYLPLRLREPTSLALLAIIITATPGTAWLDHDPETGMLLLHVFDMKDEEDWRRLICDRYEALLMEAFE